MVLSVLNVSPSLAAPIDDKRAQAATVERRLEEQGRQVSILAERYNQARLRVADVEKTLAGAQLELMRSEERMATVRRRLGQAALLAYTQGGSPSMLGELTRTGRAGGETDMILRRQYLRMSAGNQYRAIAELRSTRDDITGRRTRLEAQRRSARAAAADSDAARRQAGAAATSQRTLLAGVRGELAQLVAAQEARREAEAATRRPPAIPAPRPGPPAAPAVVDSLAKGGGRGGVAVAEGLKQIGKPYVYGSPGPDSFDCSGLTSFAWRAAGVSLSHSALVQYRETTRVPVDQIQPGDLLFFGPNVAGIHHNSMYIGGGQMVEASQTGTPVRIRGWRSVDLVGIGRPS